MNLDKILLARLLVWVCVCVYRVYVCVYVSVHGRMDKATSRAEGGGGRRILSRIAHAGYKPHLVMVWLWCTVLATSKGNERRVAGSYSGTFFEGPSVSLHTYGTCVLRTYDRYATVGLGPTGAARVGPGCVCVCVCGLLLFFLSFTKYYPHSSLWCTLCL